MSSDCPLTVWRDMCFVLQSTSPTTARRREFGRQAAQAVEGWQPVSEAGFSHVVIRAIQYSPAIQHVWQAIARHTVEARNEEMAYSNLPRRDDGPGLGCGMGASWFASWVADGG